MLETQTTDLKGQKKRPSGSMQPSNPSDKLQTSESAVRYETDEVVKTNREPQLVRHQSWCGTDLIVDESSHCFYLQHVGLMGSELVD